MHLELHILYPTAKEEEEYGLGPTPNINNFADSLLTVVFEHARAMRERTDGYLRSIVFSSSNADVCTALNWKQPNCEWLSYSINSLHSTDNELDPVLLCNVLEQSVELAAEENGPGLGRTTFSIKEAVQVARNNNLMGIICSSKLLVRNLLPA